MEQFTRASRQFAQLRHSPPTAAAIPNSKPIDRIFRVHNLNFRLYRAAENIFFMHRSRNALNAIIYI